MGPEELSASRLAEASDGLPTNSKTPSTGGSTSPSAEQARNASAL